MLTHSAYGSITFRRALLYEIKLIIEVKNAILIKAKTKRDKERIQKKRKTKTKKKQKKNAEFVVLPLKSTILACLVE